MLSDDIEPMTFPQLKKVINFGNEDALQLNFVAPWTVAIVARALSHAQSRSIGRGLHPPFVEMTAGGDAEGHGVAHKPDWAGIRTFDSGDCRKTHNILPGDTKLSYKWTSEQIVPKRLDEKDANKGWLWPLRQLFTYCLNLKTRYGYIITDKEVVVFRIRTPPERLQQGQSKRKSAPTEDGILEYMPISKSDQPAGKSELTMDMGIWLLHLLAANKRTVQSTYDLLENEVLEGLGRAPTPPLQEDTANTSDVPALTRASPANSSGSSDTAPETDRIISSRTGTFEFTAGSFASQSFASLYSTGSGRSKRKENSGEVEPTKRRRTRAKR